MEIVIGSRASSTHVSAPSMRTCPDGDNVTEKPGTIDSLRKPGAAQSQDVPVP
jgi:hypothetical protein